MVFNQDFEENLNQYHHQNLDIELQGELKEAIENAFDPSELDDILSNSVGKTSAYITKDGSYPSVVREVISWILRRQKLGTFLKKAHENNSGNTKLKTICEQLYNIQNKTKKFTPKPPVVSTPPVVQRDMELDGRTRKQFHEALLSAFPSKASLEQMVSFELDENLDTISTGGNYAEVVFTLIKWAQAQGRVKELLTAARSQNPGNPKLRSFEEQMRSTRNTNPTPVTPNSNISLPSDENSAFDVFLCHNSQDKSEVKHIGQQLIERGLRPWLDEWELPPGIPWLPELESQIKNIKSAAVFVGSSGFGPWQEQEINAFLREFVKRRCPVIPVLLPTSPDKPELPIFLSGNTWVNFRNQDPEPIQRLIWGITQQKPQ